MMLSRLLTTTMLICATFASFASALNPDQVVPEVETDMVEAFARGDHSATDNSMFHRVDDSSTPPCNIDGEGEVLVAGQQSGQTFRCTDARGAYEITVPSHCTPSDKCGLIVNTHGAYMTSQAMRQSSRMHEAALGGKKFLVVSPEDQNALWEFTNMGNQNDDAGLIADFTKKIIGFYNDIVDTNHVHAAGYSQGAHISFELLCQQSDVFCSAAPIGWTPHGEFEPPGSGHHVPGLPTCFNTAYGGTGPTHKRSIMFQLGTRDVYFQGGASHAFENSVANIKQLYNIDGEGQVLNVGAGARATQYSGAGGLTFEAVSYDFEQSSISPLGIPISGHCIPVRGQEELTFAQMGVSCGPDADGHVAEYSWGDQAIAFFESHGCDEVN